MPSVGSKERSAIPVAQATTDQAGRSHDPIDWVEGQPRSAGGHLQAVATPAPTHVIKTVVNQEQTTA